MLKEHLLINSTSARYWLIPKFFSLGKPRIWTYLSRFQWKDLNRLLAIGRSVSCPVTIDGTIFSLDFYATHPFDLTHCASDTGLSPSSQPGKHLPTLDFCTWPPHPLPHECPWTNNGGSPDSSYKSKGLLPGYLTTVPTRTGVYQASFLTYTFRTCYTFPSEKLNLQFLYMLHDCVININLSWCFDFEFF